MQATAYALALIGFLALLGVLGPAFLPDASGIFVMIGGMAVFAICMGLAALLYFGDAQS